MDEKVWKNSIASILLTKVAHLKERELLIVRLCNQAVRGDRAPEDILLMMRELRLVPSTVYFERDPPCAAWELLYRRACDIALNDGVGLVKEPIITIITVNTWVRRVYLNCDAVRINELMASIVTPVTTQPKDSE